MASSKNNGGSRNTGSRNGYSDSRSTGSRSGSRDSRSSGSRNGGRDSRSSDSRYDYRETRSADSRNGYGDGRSTGPKNKKVTSKKRKARKRRRIILFAVEMVALVVLGVVLWAVMKQTSMLSPSSALSVYPLSRRYSRTCILVKAPNGKIHRFNTSCPSRQRK